MHTPLSQHFEPFYAQNCAAPWWCLRRTLVGLAPHPGGVPNSTLMPVRLLNEA